MRDEGIRDVLFSGREDGHPAPDGPAEIAQLITAFRGLQDQLVTSHPPPEDAQRAADLTRELTALLAQHTVERWDSPVGLRSDLPGRGFPLMPPWRILSGDGSSSVLEVSFPVWFEGYLAAHGGAIALLFDEALGMLTGLGPGSRTAYLHVNYRRLTPIGTPLTVEVAIDRREGRKVYVVGKLLQDGVVLADAEGLFVEPRAT